MSLITRRVRARLSAPSIPFVWTRTSRREVGVRAAHLKEMQVLLKLSQPNSNHEFTELHTFHFSIDASYHVRSSLAIA
jgi:hypothetical protein